MKPEVITDWRHNSAWESCGAVSVGFTPCFLAADLRQELAVRERQAGVTRMSAPSSPTQDNVKMDSAVQASLSLPATPLSKGLDNAFANPTGRSLGFLQSEAQTLTEETWLQSQVKVLQLDVLNHNVFLKSYYMLVFLSRSSSIKRLRQQLPPDSLCQDIGPQHRQRPAPEGRGESVRPSRWLRFYLFKHQGSEPSACVSLRQALESKLAACRNFAKDQKARKAYSLDNSNVLNANTTSYSQSLHTSYFDKAWVKWKPTCFHLSVMTQLMTLQLPSSHVCLWKTIMQCELYHVMDDYAGWNIWDLCASFPAGQRWSHSLHWFWVIVAPESGSHAAAVGLNKSLSQCRISRNNHDCV